MARRRPATVGVYPSVASTTCSARTGPGETAHEPGRVQRRAVRGPGAAERVADADVVGHLVHVEQTQVVVAEAPLAALGHLGTDPFELRGVAGHRDVAALLEMAVDVLLGGDPTHLGDRVVHPALHPHR